MPRLTVVIVSWNVREHLRRCLTSIQHAPTHDLTVETWVVDNASTDGTPEMVRDAFPWVHLIASDENLGFAAANNLALRRMGFPLDGPAPATADLPDAIFFLNPDTEVVGDAIPQLWNTLFANPRTGMVGPRLVYGDGRHQHSGFFFPNLWQVFLDFFPLHGRLLESRLNGRYARSLYMGNAPFPADFILGAAMMVRREVILQVGAFDEGYWLYCEEMDWARRIRAAGWEIRVDPRATVIHYEGQSSRQFRAQAFVALWRSRLRYFHKYHGPGFNLAMRAIVWVGLKYLEHQARHLPPQEREAHMNAYAQVRAMLRQGGDRL